MFASENNATFSFEDAAELFVELNANMFSLDVVDVDEEELYARIEDGSDCLRNMMWMQYMCAYVYIIYLCLPL